MKELLKYMRRTGRTWLIKEVSDRCRGSRTYKELFNRLILQEMLEVFSIHIGCNINLMLVGKDPESLRMSSQQLVVFKLFLDKEYNLKSWVIKAYKQYTVETNESLAYAMPWRLNPYQMDCYIRYGNPYSTYELNERNY